MPENRKKFSEVLSNLKKISQTTKMPGTNAKTIDTKSKQFTQSISFSSNDY